MKTKLLEYGTGYTGDIEIFVYSDFGIVSYKCANHGYMGGESNLEFDQTCDLGDSFPTPTPTPTQTETPVVAVECCDGTNMTFDVTNGVGTAPNNVTMNANEDGSSDGTMCWEELLGLPLGSPDNIPIILRNKSVPVNTPLNDLLANTDGETAGFLGLRIGVADYNDKKFRYTLNSNGVCYTGPLIDAMTLSQNQSGQEYNVWMPLEGTDVNNNPTPTPTQTDTPILPTPTPTQTETPVVAVECCDGTNMTFDVTNGVGTAPNNVTMNANEDGSSDGTMCWEELLGLPLGSADNITIILRNKSVPVNTPLNDLLANTDGETGFLGLRIGVSGYSDKKNLDTP